jgi:hypothetical protein
MGVVSNIQHELASVNWVSTGWIIANISELLVSVSLFSFDPVASRSGLRALSRRYVISEFKWQDLEV